MILSDKTIFKLLREGKLKVEPFSEELVQCSSLDLRLGYQIARYRVRDFLDVKNPRWEIEYEEITKEGFFIQPKEFVLATTLEYIELPENLTAFVEGRSSLGRLGLFIENAGWVDAGFKGQLTLELFNANSYPIKLYPEMRICQLVFAKVDQKPLKPYSGKYQGQRGVVPSKIYLDYKGG
ncbi:MAG: dCTP deaminase [Gammaproteobacteria bacterium]|nr:MAG: dCTP deaminase [Gammaproteobacteria bacterium]